MRNVVGSCMHRSALRLAVALGAGVTGAILSAWALASVAALVLRGSTTIVRVNAALCAIAIAAFLTRRSVQRSRAPRVQCANPQCLADFVPFSAACLENPYPFYKALREEAPVYRMAVELGGYYTIARYADIKRVCKDSTAYSSNLVAILLSAGDGSARLLAKPGINVGPVDVLALADPPTHTQQRRTAFSGLTPKLFASLEESIRCLARKMLRREEEEEEEEEARARALSRWIG